MRDFTTKTVAALAIVGLIVASSGLVMATAPTVDSESTDTTSTTDLDDTSTQTYNTTTNSTLSYSQDSNSTALAVHQGNRELAEYGSNSSDVVEYQSVASGTYYFNGTFADDASDYTGLEADAGESVTLDLEMMNTGDDPATNTTIDITYDNGANVSFMHVNNSETMVADSTGAGIRASIFAIGGNDSDAGAAEVEDEIGVNGDAQETVTVNIANSDAQDSAAAVYDATEGTDAFSTVAVASFGGETIPVLAAGQDMPSWMDEDMTYATVSEDGNTVTVENAGFLLKTADPITLGSTALNFTQFSGAPDFTAGNALTKSGDTLDVDESQVTYGELEDVSVSAMLEGLDADKPSPPPKGAGSYYFATDVNLLYRYDGSTWNVEAGRGTASNPLPEQHVGSLSTDDVSINNIGARVHINADQTASDQTNTKVLFDVVEFDDTGEFDTTNSKFVADDDGKYFIDFYARLETMDDQDLCRASIQINGVKKTQQYLTVSGSNVVTVAADVTTELTAGDEVEVYVWHDSGEDKTINSSNENTSMTVRQVA